MFVKPTFADDAAIEQAVAILRSGGLVAFPTETVYGLGADARNPNAVKKIFTAKGRPSDHPLIVHLPDGSHLDKWANDIPESARKLADRLWPGPLTIILKKKSDVLSLVTGGQDTVGLRVPANDVAQKLIKRFGDGIAAPSANRFKRISPTRAEHVADELTGFVDMILDGGPCQVGVESTIVDLSTSIPKILRPGQVLQSELEELLGIEFQPAIEDVNLDRSDIRAPGMMQMHYAPLTLARLCESKDLQEAINEQTSAALKVGLLTYDYDNVHDNIPHIQLSNKANDYARDMYNALRKLDQMDLDVILIEHPPETETWRAVNDRLMKATHQNKECSGSK